MNHAKLWYQIQKTINIKRDKLVSFGSKDMTKNQRLPYALGYALMTICFLSVVVLSCT